MKLLVIDRNVMTVALALDFESAARMSYSDAIDAETIEHTIEEYGRCDGLRYTIIPLEA